MRTGNRWIRRLFALLLIPACCGLLLPPASAEPVDSTEQAGLVKQAKGLTNADGLANRLLNAEELAAEQAEKPTEKQAEEQATGPSNAEGQAKGLPDGEEKERASANDTDSSARQSLVPATIRVGLFMLTDTYRVVTDAVTLRGSGLAADVGGGAMGKLRLAFPDGTGVRFSLDQYNVRVAETTDSAAALSLRTQLKSAGLPAVVWKAEAAGKTVYRVTVGPYASKAEAESAKATVGRAAAPAVSSAALGLAGPHRLSAGAFADEGAAARQLAALRQAGVEAVIAITGKEGAFQYEVWLGAEADPAGLDLLQNNVQRRFSGLQLKPADLSKPYLLVYEEWMDGETALPHYRFHSPDLRIRVTAEQGKVTVAEKFGRSYRGEIELVQHNGGLAVINEVPFEEYLYSVVHAEMAAGWPAEALKAQAVAARTYAVRQGNKYGIAHVSDGTLDQVYTGADSPDVVAAVEATRGEILVDAAGPISAVYSSNAGGLTADPLEVWGNPVPYLRSVASPDETAAAGKQDWLRVELPDGQAAYVRSDYLEPDGTRNAAGFPYYKAVDEVNARKMPFVDNTNNPPVYVLKPGEKVAVFGRSPESTPYRWVRGPISAEQLTASINRLLGRPLTEPVKSLQVTERGPSGRVTGIAADGQPLAAAYPDAFRTMLGGLPSTLFEIEETGNYTIEGAGGTTRSVPENGGPLYVAGADGTGRSASEQLFVMNGSGDARLVTRSPQFIFSGKGYGHGLGMSQWGARGMAEQGKTYEEILAAYYPGTALIKE